MTPSPPEAAHFDASQTAWVLSRFADVAAAMRDPNLWGVSGAREIQPETRDEAGRLRQRATMLEALGAARIEAWRHDVEAVTMGMLASLPSNRAVDLLA